jgi:hypothetical protein
MNPPLLLDAPEKDERLCKTFPFPIERGNQVPGRASSEVRSGAPAKVYRMKGTGFP